MFRNRHPDLIRYDPVPGVKSFAMLAAIESAARGILISVLPIAMYRVYADAKLVSEVYFLVGLLSFMTALIVPWASRYIPRRWLYTGAVLVFIIGAIIGALADTWVLAIGMAFMTLAVVVITICINAYFMDYVSRSKLSEGETMRLFYSGAAWTLGPFLGVWLMGIWKPAPFIVSTLAAILLLIVFWKLRLGNGKAIHKAKAKPPNPFAFLNRFRKQPRLVAGWTLAVMRSSAWWVYVVYLPIYAVENGYSEQLGGILLSASNAFLFLTPLMLKAMKGYVRRAVMLGFGGSAVLFWLSSLEIAGSPFAIGSLVFASLFLILLDMCGGLPFLMAVRPSERTEMSAVYSTYRDVSGVITPGTASLLLIVAPLQAMFSLTAVGLFGCAYLATKLHPRLGNKRLAPVYVEFVLEPEE
ncbi:MAG: ACDE family multidrug resistance protein [Polaribacter sp.]|jgi:ACDE family multidrug resistance protein